jgi:hypothetical protein
MDQLQPDSDSAFRADIQRRLQALEATARIGLNRARYAWATGTPQTTLVYDAWDYGPVTATWQDDQGATGTKYPQVTVTHGRKAIFMVQGYAQMIANDATYKTYNWLLGAYGAGIPLDGGGFFTQPYVSRFQTHGPTTEGNNAVTVVTARADLTPGTYVYKVMGLFVKNVPAAANEPKLADPFIAVLPID